jgi:hypothetical protein
MAKELRSRLPQAAQNHPVQGRKIGQSERPTEGQHQPGNRSLGGAERADHRARGGPGAPRHQAARLDQVADGASPPGRCTGNHRTARPCPGHVGANRSRDQPGRGGRAPHSAPLRTPPRQRARQERSKKMKIDRDLANALYRTNFGAFTYRAFEAINPGQRLIPNWLAHRRDLLPPPANGERRGAQASGHQPAPPHPEILHRLGRPAGVPTGSRSQHPDHLRQLFRRARRQILPRLPGVARDAVLQERLSRDAAQSQEGVRG